MSEDGQQDSARATVEQSSGKKPVYLSLFRCLLLSTSDRNRSLSALRYVDRRSVSVEARQKDKKAQVTDYSSEGSLSIAGLLV